MYRILIFLLLLSGSTLYASVQDSTGTEKINNQLFIVHIAEKGDSYYSLAKRYQAEVKEIQEANENQPIQIGDKILIPFSTPEKHTVAKGETLYAISSKYHISVDEIKKINKLKTNDLKEGQLLILKNIKSTSTTKQTNTKPTTTTTEKPKATEITHIVKAGETLSGISEKYLVKSEEIIKINKLKNTNIQIGQKLIIPKTATPITKQAVKQTKTITKITEVNVGENEKFSKKHAECLHPYLPIGHIIKLEVDNKIVYVKVIGRASKDQTKLIVNQKTINRLQIENTIFKANMTTIE